MIQQIIGTQEGTTHDDSVQLSWFDMQKPNLSATTKNGVNILYKDTPKLRPNSQLVCENGSVINIELEMDLLYVIACANSSTLATIAYEIGNLHQSICIKKQTIIVLQNPKIKNVITALGDKSITITEAKDYFLPNERIR